MATVYDITTVPLANVNWIDALLDSGPDWNFLTTDGTSFRKTLYYTFSTTTGTETGVYSSSFNSSQIAAARNILAYAGSITGINFAETGDGSLADIHFSQTNLSASGINTAGSFSYSGNYNYNYAGSFLTSYTADAWVYLDNRSTTPFYASNQNPVAGNSGYETLLHEIGHTLGLKHPFSTIAGNPVTLPTAEDTTANTLMSYTDAQPGLYYSSYSRYDVAALNWLYGIDGLGGSWGIGTSGYYYTGTNGNDTFLGGWSPSAGYNFAYQGGTGTDTVILGIPRTNLSYMYENGWLTFTGAGSSKLYINPDIELVQFSDVTMSTYLPKNLYGTNGNDIIRGSTGDDQIFAYSGNDILSGDAGSDILDGGSGTDTALYNENRSAVTIIKTGDTTCTVNGSLNSGSDFLLDVERLKFTDSMVALDTSGGSGEVYRLYQAALDRIPDAEGLGFWINAVDRGANLITDIARNFINSQEFTAKYGANPSDGDFVASLYNNVLHRQYEQSGYLFWIDCLAKGADRAAVLYGFSESIENQTNVASLIANGIAYREWIG